MQSFHAIRALSRREIGRVLRVWMQTILPSYITAILYLFVFGEIIGKRIGSIDGYDYITFIIPGIIMLGVITNAYSNSSSSFYSNKFTRSIEEILVSPMTSWQVLLSFVIASIFRAIVIAIGIGVICYFFSGFHIAHIWLSIFIILITASIFGLLGLINGIYARSFDDIAIVPTFFLTPLIFFGGVFYNVSTLPDIFQRISMLNPIYYIIDLFRYAILNDPRHFNLSFDVFIPLCLVVFCWFLTSYLYSNSPRLRS